MDGRIARLVAGLACIGAAAIHVVAATAHAQHPAVAAFFSLLAASQAALGVTAISSAAFPAAATVLLNSCAVVVWLVSRTRGIPFVPGAEAIEPAAHADSLATLLELTAIAAAGIARRLQSLDWPALAAARARSVAALVAVAVTVAAAAGVADLAGNDHADHGGATAVAAGADAADAAGRDGDVPATVAAQGSAASTTSSEDHSHSHQPTQVTAGASSSTSSAPPSPARRAVRSQDSPTTPTSTTTLRYGPFVLAPAGVSESTHANIYVAGVDKPCGDCYVTALRPDLVYEDGSSANLDTGPMLHHAVWYQTGTADATCGRRVRGERFFASGNERTAVHLPAGFGVPITTSPWDMVVELMNHGPGSQTVYVQLEVEHLPASAPDIQPVRAVWLDIANCGNSQYAVPAGPSRAASRWTSTVTGRVVAAGGHVHDGGVKTVLSNGTTGSSMCTSWAGYGRDPAYEGSIESMSTCIQDDIGIVRAGEALQIEAYYDSAEAQTDVMGIMLAYIFPTTDLSD